VKMDLLLQIIRISYITTFGRAPTTEEIYDILECVNKAQKENEGVGV